MLSKWACCTSNVKICETLSLPFIWSVSVSSFAFCEGFSTSSLPKRTSLPITSLISTAMEKLVTGILQVGKRYHKLFPWLKLSTVTVYPRKKRWHPIDAYPSARQELVIWQLGILSAAYFKADYRMLYSIQLRRYDVDRWSKTYRWKHEWLINSGYDFISVLRIFLLTWDKKRFVAF